MSTTKILGLVKAIHVASSAPTNTNMVWRDTNVNIHKTYNPTTMLWEALAGSGASWSSALAVSPNSGSSSPIIDAGQSLNYEDSGFTLTLDTQTLTGNQALLLPNASGVLGLAGLTNTLASNNETGGSDIRLSNGDVVSALSGTGTLDLRYLGVDGSVLLLGSQMTLESSASYTKINSSAGQPVTIGAGAFTPSATQTLIVSSSTNVEAVFRKNTAANMARISIYSDVDRTFSIYSDSSEDVHFVNSVPAQNMHFAVDDVEQVMSLIGTKHSVNIDKCHSFTSEQYEDPASTTVSAADTSFMEYETSAGTWNIDDIEDGFAGKQLHILNTGVGSLVLRHDTGSAGSKILCPNAANYMLGPNEGATLHYSAITSIWYILSN